MRWLFACALFLCIQQSFCQVALSPLEDRRVEVGDVVEVRVVHGSEPLGRLSLKSLLEQFNSDKFYFMDVYERNGEQVAKIVLASKFSESEIIQITGFDGVRTLELKGFIFQSTKAEKKELIYNDIPLMEEFNYKKWSLVLLVVIVVGTILRLLSYFIALRKKKKDKIKKVKDWVRRLESATNLSSCSEIWIQREIARRDLQGFGTELEAFFATLSPAQFKLVPPDDLNDEVKKAKAALISKIQEKRFGI